MNTPSGESRYAFGSFRLKPMEKMLECEGKEVRLHKQWYDILLMLVRCKRIVTSEELKEAIWPGEVVPRGANLFVNIFELRQALKRADSTAAEFIRNHPRQGYSFTATVEEQEVPMTVAILPFKAGEGQDVTDESGLKLADKLTVMLNKHMSIRVRRPDTVIREYNAHPNQRPLIFGHRLEADYVFSGRILRDLELIEVEFLDVRADEVRASKSFEGCRPESPEAHRLIHAWMESALGLTPAADEKPEQPGGAYTTNRKANEYYANGRIQRFRGTEMSLRRAIAYFKRATTEDPDFAQAYVGVAGTYIFMGMLNLIPPRESYEGARDAAIKAREKDESLTGAHTTWAFIKLFFERRWDEAQGGFARAIGINSKYPAAHMGYAHCLTAQGRHAEARAEIDQALALDPYSFFISFVRGMVLFLARQYDQSLKQFEQTQSLSLRFNLKSDLPHYGISLAHEYCALTGEADECERLFEKADEEARLAIKLSKSHPLKLMHRAQLKAMWGKRDDALKLLDEVLKLRRSGHYVSPYHLGILYASLEEADRAIESLEEALGALDQYLFLTGVDPRLDSLRSDSRFRDFFKGLKVRVE